MVPLIFYSNSFTFFTVIGYNLIWKVPKTTNFQQ